MKTVTLFNRIPPKSAVYVAALVERAGGWVVTYQNARIGATMPAPKDKTPELPYDAAEKLYDKLVAEKMRGGYKPDEGGGDVPPPAAAVASDIEARESGLLPQLLNEVEGGVVVGLLDDNGWGAEEKFDGKRMMLRYEGGRLSAINRKGLVCGVAAAFVAAAEALGERAGEFVIDGEAVGEVFYAFDLLVGAEGDLRSLPFSARRLALMNLLASGPPSGGRIILSGLALNSLEKRELYHRLGREGREGVVFKRLDAPYTAGRPNRGGDQLKRKFYSTATFVVARRNPRRSVALELLDGEGRAVAVGNVTIPVNFDLPAVGACVEVRYLYAFPGGSVYQPVYLGLRDDIDGTDCRLSQLKFKAPDSSADDVARAA
jgi:bifunctional non-homologous end joining protein LigD